MLNIGDKVLVILQMLTFIEVEVTDLHSGYYDYQYTGEALYDGSTVYFSEDINGAFYGRAV